ncbi:type VI secretion system baseplate subunit TssE [Paragemmobacter straminiformis]|uniref:Type VI secretion system baseplate subunit TssE n=1 Tax=Paragemmobacter straminiformis TaxID=2045119 RepID=A0A842IAR7_9RHOB|nr:type VI secretion system baseplate subunit TssE [Gemmobacter straminiformis]MBC2836437.1 type VI secretion system baseplate subunit TssE [Gemmobacter straminiformis]
MAERNEERLQPSLLDRLTDNAPGDLRESRDDRVIDLRRLREIVQRDLSWLLNTSDNHLEIDAQKYPHAARSVLNYGISEIAGGYSTDSGASTIRASIQRAIERYEPRISAGSLDVRIRGEKEQSQAIVAFDIIAEMWAQPMPIELYLRSEIDLTSGQLKLERKT